MSIIKAEQLQDLEWVKELVASLPEISAKRKNFYEIAGFPRWETINSNILAYYFEVQDNEEHKFSSLFIDSLLELIELKKKDFIRENYSSEFDVEREVYTENGKFIDILIKEAVEEEEEESWAIIIENKLDAPLYNELGEYWTSVKAKNKIGVVLSINNLENKVKEKHSDFINIQHNELVQQVKKNLSDFFINADDRHLLFLKEYFENVESLYIINDQEIMDEVLKQFQEKSLEIEKFHSTEADLKRFVFKTVASILAKENLSTNAKQTASRPVFMYKVDDTVREVFNCFYMGINLQALRVKNPSFKAVFELRRKYVQYGKKLQEKLKLRNEYTRNVKEGEKEGNSWYHIYNIEIPLKDFSEKSLEESLESSLSTYLFKGKFLENSIEEMENILKEKKERINIKS